jgi:hypothetical protein
MAVDNASRSLQRNDGQSEKVAKARYGFYRSEGFTSIEV